MAEQDSYDYDDLEANARMEEMATKHNKIARDANEDVDALFKYFG